METMHSHAYRYWRVASQRQSADQGLLVRMLGELKEKKKKMEKEDKSITTA
jgi:hypothetical protein